MVQNGMSVIAGKQLKKHIKNSVYRTQENFAEAMFVNATTVRRWIANGISKVDVIEEIAAMFDMTFLDFLTK